MKTTLIGIAAALVLTSFGVAHAEENSVRVSAPRHQYLSDWEYRDFRNTYQLENGEKIAFTLRMSRFYTQLADGERVRLYPISANTFVSDAGTTFVFRDDGELVDIANYEKLPLAGKSPANTVMVASAKR